MRRRSDAFVGIDGGGTRATAVAVDRSGAELARVDGAAGLVRSADPTAGADALCDLVEKTLDAADAAPPAAALCCALAGAGREAERAAVEAALRRRGIARRILVTSDAEAALHDALDTGSGILLIAGTGSIAWGRGPDGHTGRAGGWGDRLGDEGSGFALGLSALRAAMRAYDGRGSDTVLLERVLRETDTPAPERLVHWTADAAKADIAALAPHVITAADQGDAVARSIIERAADALARHVDALHRRLGPWPAPPPLVPAGGLLLPGRPLRPHLAAALDRAGPSVSLSDRFVDAARGAARLARATPGP